MTTPVDSPNTTDPGDDVARRFRYQHAYGVILWIAAFRGELKYISLWCEQHEDFLAQLAEKEFEAYQVKTREAEHGYWELSHEPLFKSIKRFVALEKQYPGQIRRYIFVSNAKCNETPDEKRHHMCPLAVFKGCAGTEPLPEFCKKAIEYLAEKTECQSEDLFTVLKKTEVQLSPSLTDIDDAVRQTHLSQVDALKECSVVQISTLFNLLLGRVRDASSLASNSPARHYPGSCADPRLANKRILIADLESQLEYITMMRTPASRAPGMATATRKGVNGESQMSQLIEKYQAETATDTNIKLMIEKLKEWHERPEGDVIGLEEKLRLGHRPDLIDFGMLAKDRFARTLGRYEHSKAAQEIYAYLLAQLWTLFSELVYTKISNGSSRDEVTNALVNDVYPRVEKLLESNPLGIDVGHIRGMLFWLTGNCHIKWAPNVNLQSSI